MSAPVKVLVHGLTDAAQAIDLAAIGVDGVVVAVGGGALPCVDAATGSRVAAALPPLAARLALLGPDAPLPAGFTGAVTQIEGDRPAGAIVHLARLPAEPIDPEQIPGDLDGLWVRPRAEGSSSATRFDFGWIERLSRRFRLVIEIPDGAAGVETVVRLARPYAVLLGDAVWFRPGILELDAVERAVGVVARLNKSCY